MTGWSRNSTNTTCQRLRETSYLGYPCAGAGAKTLQQRTGEPHCVMRLVGGGLWLKSLPVLDVNTGDGAAGVFQQSLVINDA